MKLVDVNEHTLRDVGVKQCFEWVKTGKWKFAHYRQWLKAKGINGDRDVFFGRTLIHTPSAAQSYEQIRVGWWNTRQFTSWLNRKFF